MRIHAVLVTLSFATGLASQDLSVPEGFPDLGDPCCLAGGIPRTMEQMLERRGIQLTKQALLGALLDPRAVVRSLAAQELASDWPNDSITAISAALSAERAAGTREIMAHTLASLGDRQGVAALRAMCTANFSARLRVTAAEDLLRLNDEHCVDDIIDVLQSVKESTALDDRVRDGFVQVNLIDLEGLPLEHPSESQLKEIRGLAVGCLSSKSPDLRMAASRALGKFGDTVSAQELERALAAEQDEAVRARMLGDLQRMRDRQHGPGGDHN